MTIFGGDESQESITLIEELNETIAQQKLVLADIKKLYGMKHVGDEDVISIQIKDLSENLKKLNKKIEAILNELIIPRTFFQHILRIPRMLNILKKEKGIEPDELEKETLKRLKTRAKIKKEKEKVSKEGGYTKLANRLFSKTSKRLIEKKYFEGVRRDLEKANLKFTLPAYVSVILLTTFLAFIGGLAIFAFFIFFGIQATVPIVKVAEDFGARALGLIWIPIAFPIAGFIISYTYPSLERRSAETQIDYELPFAAINMAAIAGSMINPVKIFEIIISSEEFPYVKKELTKLLNQINVYGYDIVSALRSASMNTPSKKMGQLFNGLATTINTGGDLAEFFDKRAESLLFEYGLQREKETKASETFMDLYISIVIAAPMIFMLLLMIIKIAGLGISISTSAIGLIIISAVAVINVLFLVFLHLKKSK